MIRPVGIANPCHHVIPLQQRVMETLQSVSRDRASAPVQERRQLASVIVRASAYHIELIPFVERVVGISCAPITRVMLQNMIEDPSNRKIHFKNQEVVGPHVWMLAKFLEYSPSF